MSGLGNRPEYTRKHRHLDALDHQRYHRCEHSRRRVRLAFQRTCCLRWCIYHHTPDSISATRITRADSTCLAPMGCCTSAWATAGVRAIRTATARTATCCSASCFASTWIAAIRIIIPAANPYAKGGGQRRNLGDRPSESVAVCVRSFFGTALHRGRRRGPIRGSQRRSDVDRRRQLRLEHHGRPVCYGSSSCNQSGLQKPAVSYSTTRIRPARSSADSVYRGQKIPEIKGQYFYSDYCNSWLRSFGFADGKVTDQHEWPVGRLGSITSFGEDSSGRVIYLHLERTGLPDHQDPGNPAR